jgi:hypothetical protein
LPLRICPLLWMTFPLFYNKTKQNKKHSAHVITHNNLRKAPTVGENLQLQQD